MPDVFSQSASAAGAVTILPQMGTNSNVRFEVDGKPAVMEGDAHNVRFRIATPGYFASLAAPILQGHDFDGAGEQVIVSRSLQDRFFPAANAVGHRC